MNDENQDSFELFADTLTITLGCIIFIALLLVTITRSHQMDKSDLFDFERRSELLSRQISIAEQSLASAEKALNSQASLTTQAQDVLEYYEAQAHSALAKFYHQTEAQYANALASENIRTQVFITKYPWMTETIRSNIESLDARIDRAFAEASKEAIALSVLREKAIKAPIPLYYLLKGDILYPVSAGPYGANQHVSWTRTGPQNVLGTAEKWQLSPIEGLGLGGSDAWAALQEDIEGLTRDSESQVVLLVYEDSFRLARELLAELSQEEVNFSWRPFEMEQRIVMSKDGLPPDSPF